MKMGALGGCLLIGGGRGMYQVRPVLAIVVSSSLASLLGAVFLLSFTNAVCVTRHVNHQKGPGGTTENKLGTENIAGIMISLGARTFQRFGAAL